MAQRPFEETFWAKGFGMLIDHFGTPWMVNGARPVVDGAGCLAAASASLGRESAQSPKPKGESPVFMTLIDKTFGDAVITRTWDRQCAVA